MVSTSFLFAGGLQGAEGNPAFVDPIIEHVLTQGGVLNNPETKAEPKKGERLSSWLKAGWALKNVSGWGSHGAVFHVEHDR